MAGGECNAMRGSRKECGCVEKCAAACGKIGGVIILWKWSSDNGCYPVLNHAQNCKNERKCQIAKMIRKTGFFDHAVKLQFLQVFEGIESCDRGLAAKAKM